MSLVLQLSDGTTTLDFLGSTYAAQALDLGNPADIRAEAMSLFREGWDLIAQRFTKRTITISLKVTTASLLAMDTAIRDLHEALRKARLWAMHDLDSRWRLQFNPGGSATSVYFVVKNGGFALPPESLRATLMLKDTNPIILRASLVLECDPLGEGTEETLENY